MARTANSYLLRTCGAFATACMLLVSTAAAQNGAGNVAHIARALREALERRGLSAELPWYFPSAAEYRAKLEAGGFAVETIELFPRPTPLPGDISGWIETFAEAPLARLPDGRRAEFLGELRERLRPHLRKPDGSWIADYVRLRFKATKRG